MKVYFDNVDVLLFLNIYNNCDVIAKVPSASILDMVIV